MNVGIEAIYAQAPLRNDTSDTESPFRVAAGVRHPCLNHIFSSMTLAWLILFSRMVYISPSSTIRSLERPTIQFFLSFIDKIRNVLTWIGEAAFFNLQ